eukprot:781209-Pelagomonas_calceolata.AAC.2
MMGGADEYTRTHTHTHACTQATLGSFVTAAGGDTPASIAQSTAKGPWTPGSGGVHMSPYILATPASTLPANGSAASPNHAARAATAVGTCNNAGGEGGKVVCACVLVLMCGCGCGCVTKIGWLGPCGHDDIWVLLAWTNLRTALSGLSDLIIPKLRLAKLTSTSICRRCLSNHCLPLCMAGLQCLSGPTLQCCTAGVVAAYNYPLCKCPFLLCVATAVARAAAREAQLWGRPRPGCIQL